MERGRSGLRWGKRNNPAIFFKTDLTADEDLDICSDERGGYIL
ncbi:11550_t:CDS:2 [Paraglomus brasilianum]|uniref:11550_t:CDS:1 n=1 Tax=Paraglomus brasilianum TaxID=144538 RepID=A0A9N8WHE3_9GLOM|nr:11550_t:CDS:2 [Paraglomus brasilianum]